MSTVYTFHAAIDHRVIATAEPATLQLVAANVAADLMDKNPSKPDTTKRVYVHNGRAIIAAGLIRDGLWHDTLRDNYEAFEAKARERREAAGIATE